MTTSVAIIGSGNIATDLMLKIKRLSSGLNVAAMAGIDPESDGLARARRMDVATTHHGVSGLLDLPAFADVRVVFDATSAGAHPRNYAAVSPSGAVMVDMTPAAIGPYVVPAVNIDTHGAADNVNMVTCGGQATVPIVSAISRVTPVVYGEIVASIASRSAGPGTRANIDEFTETTSRAIEEVGGAAHGKAVIVLNPADPPLVMRNTVFCLVREADEHAIRESVERRVQEVRTYVPGYRLKHDVQFDRVQHDYVPVLGTSFTGSRVSVFLEVTGAGHYLPDYAGNLDIMTSAALRTGELMAIRQSREANT